MADHERHASPTLTNGCFVGFDQVDPRRRYRRVHVLVPRERDGRIQLLLDDGIGEPNVMFDGSAALFEACLSRGFVIIGPQWAPWEGVEA